MSSPTRAPLSAVTLGAVVATVAVAAPIAGALLGVWAYLFDHFVVQTAIFGTVLATVAALGLRNQPGNLALRTILWFGVLMVVEVVGYVAFAGLVRYEVGLEMYEALVAGTVAPADLPTHVAAVLWLPLSIWMVSLGGFLTFGFLLFPDGRMPGRRWGSVGWLAAAGISATAVGYAIAFHPGSHVPLDELDPSGLAGTLLDIGFPLVAIAMIGSVASLIVRYRGAEAEERHQIRWVGFGAVIIVVIVFAAIVGPLVTGGIDPTVANYASMLAVPILLGSYGTAVLKYRLYDIDVVISRTLVFGVLAVFITGVYVAVVVGVGSLLGRSGEPDLALSIAATALVAVAFEPVRALVHGWANRLVFGRGATPYDVLGELTGRLSSEPSERTLDRLAELVRAGTGATRAVVWLRVADRLRPAATGGAGTGLAPTSHRDLQVEHLPGDQTVAVEHDGELLGALSITKGRGDAVTPVDERLLADTAAGAALLLRNLRLQAELAERAEQLRASRQRLVAAQDETRRRIERDLHDGAQQYVVALKVKVALARTIATREAAADGLPDDLDRLAEQTQTAIDSLRTLARGIYPPLLEAEGLRAAVANLASLLDVPVAIAAEVDRRYPPDVEATVYFAVAEALNNAAKHARPTAIRVELTDTSDGLSFRVIDDGDGFDPAVTAWGVGLTTVTDRVRALDGRLDVTSRRGRGTTISGSLPADTGVETSADTVGAGAAEGGGSR